MQRKLHRGINAVRLRRRVSLAIAAVIQCAALAEVRAGADKSCRQLEQTVAAGAPGPNIEISLDHAIETAGPGCIGAIFSNLATAASLEGRVRDVQRYAERSISLLAEAYGPNHATLLRPLAFLSASSLELQEGPKARRAYRRLLQIVSPTPEGRAMVHEVAAKLLQNDGRLADATDEILAAIRERTGTGGDKGADGAWYYLQLGGLYIDQGRFTEAREAVARGSSILGSAPDATPLDRIRMLETEAIIDAQGGNWRAADQKLGSALAIADATPAVDPSATRSLLEKYAFVLRKVGRGRDARAIEKRLAALPPDPSAAIVDVRHLARERRH